MWNYRKHRYQLADEQKNQRNIIFIDKEMTTKVIMDCRTRAVHKSIIRLMLKQFDVS